MERGRCGLALALGLFAVAHVGPLHAEDGFALRFVGDPDVLRSVKALEPEPAANAGAVPTLPARTPEPVPQATPRVPKGSSPSWPVTLTEAHAKAEAATSDRADVWPEDEIEAARAQCAALLKTVDAVVVAEDPIKEGECGAPAPVRLISIGRKPEVVVSPPAIVNCEMVVALATWLKRDLQPLARKHLGGPIIKIDKMSDYSCRNAYGRAKGRLSEHGRVNALDIAGFTTAQGDSAMLLADWGMTARDIRRQVAAAKAKAAVAERQRLVAERAGQENARSSMRHAASGEGAAEMQTGSLPPAALGVTSGAPAGGIARASIIEGIPRVTVSLPGAAAEPADIDIGAGMSRLGGPKPHHQPAPAPIVVRTQAKASGALAELRKQRFLRGAQDAACRIFGTVLGPEANNAHRNHFHVDLAKRNSGAFCQ